MLLALLTVGGCTRNVYYAVVAPNVSMSDDRSCFRHCQTFRAAGTKDYLGCLNTCSDVRVTAESECKEVPFDSSQYGCTTEHDRTFSSGRLIVAIIATVLGLVLLSASLPNL